ncbi:MAG: ROK family protein, partial [Actinobacteria bacterium]|nr:ROK family protein [Actinomycetota bacterium]
IRMIESLLVQASAPVLGIGVGAPGIVGPEGIVLESANLDWHGREFGAELRNRFEIPVSIANDAAMAAMAEYRRRPTDRDVVLVKIGRGVGAGVVLKGNVVRGQHSAAGEIGHVRVVEGGDPCRCGRDGCLETVASVPAILRRLGANADEQPWDALALAGVLGDDPVRDSIAIAGRHIGLALAGVVATVDVGHIVVASELRNSSDILIEAIREELANRILPASSDWIEIEATQLGGDLVLKGAASAVLIDRLGALLR